ncbi:MAG TPA: DNA polymerase III subunit delta [Haliangiales bacterium]|nr:DNA polymerase III subunit delta [Haliangiales bacterium]
MTEPEARIRRGEIDPVYVVVGSDPLLHQRVVGALAAALVPEASRAFNFDQLEAKPAGAQAIVNAARTLPMMGGRRLVVARDFDALPVDGLAALAAYLEAPSAASVLVLQAQRGDGRMKLVQLAKKKGWYHELAAPRQLVPWIQEEAKARGVRLAGDAARRLADVVGGDLSRLSSALEQLSLYVGDERAISAADVDELIAETREHTVFELANAVGEGKEERALRAVAKLFDQRESAVGVAMMLARHVRQLAAVRELLDARAPRADIPRLAGVPSFALDGLVVQARRFGPPALRRAVALLAQADIDLKGPKKGALGERIVVEKLVRDLLALA